MLSNESGTTIRHSGDNKNVDNSFAEELAASIAEFNSMVEEIAVLEMRVLFKQATASVAKNFSAQVKRKYGLELDETHSFTRLIQE